MSVTGAPQRMPNHVSLRERIRDGGYAPLTVMGAHVALFLGLAWWSWRKWPDPLIDFGRELYVPWRITEGQVLYRDIESLFGPLSPYVNALWFRLFGVSLTTLVVCNLAILAATTAGIYHLVRVSTDRTAATVATLATMMFFGFGQFLRDGNYNFITPYSHEATHGLALAVAMIVCLHRAMATGRRSAWALGGLCFGAVMLTKPETALAAAAAVGAGIVVAWRAGVSDRRTLAGPASLFLGAATVLPVVFFLYFLQHMPPAVALNAVGRAFTATLGSTVTQNQYYLRVMGLDQPWTNLARVVLTFVAVVAYLLMAATLAWFNHPTPARSSRMGPVLPFLMMLVALFATLRESFATGLPLTCLAGVLAMLAAAEDPSRRRTGVVAALPLVMWGAFGLVLLLKIGLNPKLNHYGFYLALPATVLLFAQVCWLIPEMLRRSAPDGADRTFRQIAIAAIAAVALPHLLLSQLWYQAKTVEVGSGSDLFLASSASGQWQGTAVVEAMREIRRRGGDSAYTVAVLPEGVMLNYLLRRSSPLRIVTLMPPEILVFGEDAVLQSLRSSPPDFVALAAKDMSEYGYPPFGTAAHYGQRTMQWIRSQYRSVAVVGKVSDVNSGIEILQRGAMQSQSPP